jgi:DNA primase
MPPKYLHSDGFDRNLHLYGENRVEDGSGLVYVVEGHLDALMLWQWGYRPVVALLGSHPGGAQIEKLVAYYERLLVVPDGDAAGRKMVEDLKAGVAWRIPVMSRIPENGKDPCSLGQHGCRDLLGPPPVSIAA